MVHIGYGRTRAADFHPCGLSIMHDNSHLVRVFQKEPERMVILNANLFDDITHLRRKDGRWFDDKSALLEKYVKNEPIYSDNALFIDSIVFSCERNPLR